MRLIVFLTISLMLFGSPLTFAQNRIYVDRTVASPGNGSSWATAKRTIEEGMAALGQSGGEVWITAYSYPETLNLVSNVSLIGGFVGTESSADQRPGDEVTDLNVSNVTGVARPIFGDGVRNVLVDGLRISGGHDNGSQTHDGGGIYLANVDSSVVFRNCEISDNQAADGGGIYIRNSEAPIFENCTITSNQASDDGGGIYTSANGGVTLLDCIVTDNDSGDYGGGIYSSVNSPIFVQDSEIGGNTAVTGGGGIAVRASAATITTTDIHTNSISGSSTAGGGGLYAFENSVLGLTESNLSDNRGGSANRGGGVYISGTNATIVGVDFEDNSTSNGGGLYALNSSGRIANCLFRTGFGAGGGGLMLENAFPLIEDCFIYTNEAVLGGGIFFNGAEGTVRTTMIAGNTASNEGVALAFANNSSVLIDRCNIVGNFGDGESTIEIDRSDPIFRNTIISGNYPQMRAISNILASGSPSAPIFENCTIADNDSASGSTALALTQITTLTMRNTIISRNGNQALSRDNSQEVQLLNCLFSGHDSIIDSNTGTSDLADDPNFATSLNANPRFIGGSENAFRFRLEDTTFESYDFIAGTTTLRSNAVNLIPNSLVGRSLYIFGTSKQWGIVGNTENTIEFAGQYQNQASSGEIRIVDYSTQVQSVAIDAGTANGVTYADDFLGMSRVVDVSGVGAAGNIAIDIGAYEYRGNTSPAVTSTSPIYVNAEATGSNDGTSWINAYTSLEDAMTDSRAQSDPIWVAAGQYGGTDAQSNVRVYGGFREGDLDISNRNPDLYESVVSEPGTTLMRFNNVQNAEIDGLVFRDATAGPSSQGSAIRMMNQSSGVTIRNCLFEGNTTSSYGGAVVIESSSNIDILDCEFNDNSSFSNDGGALVIGAATDVLVDRCVFFQNQTDEYGGAVVVADRADARITNSFFRQNIAGEGGAGIYAIEADITVEASTFLNNANAIGNGIFTEKSNLIVRDSDFIGNGGGFHSLAILFSTDEGFPETSLIERCRFTGSTGRSEPTSANEGGMVSFFNGTHTVRNCVFEGNTFFLKSAGIITAGVARVDVYNSTFANNEVRDDPEGTAINIRQESTGNLYNCIFASGVDAAVRAETDASYSITNCLFDSPNEFLITPDNQIINRIGDLNALAEAGGNLNAPPKFVYRNNDRFTGDWESASTFEGQFTTYTDASADFVPGELIGKTINTAVQDGNSRSLIIGNTETSITVLGVSSPGNPSSEYQIYDYQISIDSIAVDNGISEGAPAIDIAGNTRPIDVPGLGSDGPGQGIDIGAYEQAQTSIVGGLPDAVYVSWRVPAGGDGTTWTSAYRTIQEAIDDPASATKPIWIEQGGYREAIQLRSNRKLYGGFEMGDLSKDSRNSSTIVPPSDRQTPAWHLISIVDVSNVTLDRLNIYSANANGPTEEDKKGASIYMVSARGQNLFTDLEIVSGRAVFGGLLLIRDSNARFVRTEFTTGLAELNGGAIYVEGNSDLVLTDSSLTGNTATSGGGAAISMTDDSNVNLINTSIEAGTTGGIGAAILQQGGNLYMLNSEMRFASAQNGGGFIALTNGTVKIENSVMTNANSPLNGGAFYQTGGLLEVDGVVITGCSANSGSVLYQGGGSATLNNVTLRDNFAGVGVIHNSGGYTLLSNSRVWENEGITIYTDDADVDVAQTEFVGNIHGDTNSLFRYGGGNSSMVNSTFTGHKVNDATLIEYSGGTHTMTNCTISDNRRSEDQSLIFAFGDVAIRNSMFTYNIGRVIEKRSANTNLELQNNLFDGNTVDLYDAASDTAYTGGSALNQLSGSVSNIDGEPGYVHLNISTSPVPYFAAARITAVNGETLTLEILTPNTPISRFSNGPISIGEYYQQTIVIGDSSDSITVGNAFDAQTGQFVYLMDYRPVFGSDAIDNASLQYAPPIDIIGSARPKQIDRLGDDVGYDIGAYEYIPGEIATDPTSIDFGNVALTATRRVRVQNVGDLPLAFYFSRESITNDASGSFSLEGPSLPDLLAGNFFNLTVRFTPTSPGPKTATLSIISDDPNRPYLEVPITGNGVDLPSGLLNILSHLLDLDLGSTPSDTNSDGVLDAADIPGLLSQ